MLCGQVAITGNCGFMMNFQDYVANKTDTVVLMSSLMQLPMLSASLGAYENRGLEPETDKIIVMTANGSSFEKSYDTLVPKIWGISRSQILVLDCLKIEGFGKEVCLSLGLFGSFAMHVSSNSFSICNTYRLLPRPIGCPGSARSQSQT